MNTNNILKISTWDASIKLKNFPKLSKSKNSDVVIVGGGLAGMISAYLLTKKGKKVILVERKKIASGATMRTTAFLTHSIDTDYADLISTFGLKEARAIIDSHDKAIDLIKNIVEEENIDCDFKRCSNIVYAMAPEDFSILEEEFKALKQIGKKGKLFKNGSKLGFKNFGYLEISNQAKYHPLKFIEALIKIIIKNGGEIYENTKIKDIKSDGTAVGVKTSDNIIIYANWAIITTYEPFNKPLRLYFKKAFYASYVVEGILKNLNIPEGIYEDTYNPYHYFRIDKIKDETRFIAGGEDHRMDIPVSEKKSFNALKDYLDNFIGKENYELTKQWAGPILEPVDGIAHIGSFDQKNVLYAMSFSGNGMTYSAITSMIFSNIICNEKNSKVKMWEEIYTPHRTPSLRSLLTKGKDYSEELIRGGIKNTFTQNKKSLKRKK
jgi:glycine/D-amino acid oxidase-like deaminating enzyme